MYVLPPGIHGSDDLASLAWGTQLDQRVTRYQTSETVSPQPWHRTVGATAQPKLYPHNCHRTHPRKDRHASQSRGWQGNEGGTRAGSGLRPQGQVSWENKAERKERPGP